MYNYYVHQTVLQSIFYGFQCFIALSLYVYTSGSYTQTCRDIIVMIYHVMCQQCHVIIILIGNKAKLSMI